MTRYQSGSQRLYCLKMKLMIFYNPIPRAFLLNQRSARNWTSASLIPKRLSILKKETDVSIKIHSYNSPKEDSSRKSNLIPVSFRLTAITTDPNRAPPILSHHPENITVRITLGFTIAFLKAGAKAHLSRSNLTDVLIHRLASDCPAHHEVNHSSKERPVQEPIKDDTIQLIEVETKSDDDIIVLLNYLFFTTLFTTPRAIM